MDDPGGRPLCGDRVEHARQLASVRNTARRNPRHTPKPGKLVNEFARALGQRTTTTHEQQMTNVVLPGEMAGHERTQPTGATGDEHSAPAIQSGGRVSRPRAERGQSWHVDALC